MSMILISENANIVLKDHLINKGHLLCEVVKTASVYDAISSHPDIYACKLDDELIVSKDLLPFSEKLLMERNIKYIPGASIPGYRYPENIIYNAVQLGTHFVHNTKYTDPILLNAALEKELCLVHVNQGYTKCNTVSVDANSAITSDNGIASALTFHGIDALVATPGHVKLESFPYGFLGGASGRVDDEIIFNGNLSNHPDYFRIKNFIEERKLRVVFFEDYPLEDIGSIIQL
ncbi:MAG: hypothetical protein PHE79_01430 [Eubacteriales bacterium]|nr:hypothetical protein [Eubacteriales bacterium]